MTNRHLYLLAALLALVGLGLAAYKAVWLEFPLFPRGESPVWSLEAKVTFVAQGGPVKATLMLPSTGARMAILDESFVSGGYGLLTQTQEGNRQALWTIRKAQGSQALFYRANLVGTLTPQAPQNQTAPRPRPPGLQGAKLAAARNLVEAAQAKSSDALSLAAHLLLMLNQQPPQGETALLLGKSPSLLRRLGLAARLLALAQAPARVVHGVRLDQERRRVPVIHWLEVHHKGAWRQLDPDSGQVRSGKDTLAWWRGPGSLVRVEGGQEAHCTLASNINLTMDLQAAVQRGGVQTPWLLRFSLFSLPIETQQVYRVLLLLPVGALVLIVLRNLVGIATFGTFMPVLIALAFRETRLFWGLALFCLLVALGLAIRLYLERLKLLVVPRLAAVLMVVVGVMALLSLLMHQLGLAAGLSVALFPMVILTMTIERMSIVWEERGPAAAVKQGAGSLLAASLAYLVMNISLVEHLFYVFPELILVLLAITLLLGRYAGYRLTELYRFKALLKGDQ